MPFVVGSEVRDIQLDGSPNDIDLSNDGKYLAVAIHKGKPCVRLSRPRMASASVSLAKASGRVSGWRSSTVASRSAT